MAWPLKTGMQWPGLLLGALAGAMMLAFPGTDVALVLGLAAGAVALLAHLPLAFVAMSLALPFLPNLPFMLAVSAALAAFLLRVALVGDVYLRLPRNLWLYVFLALLALAAVTSVQPATSLRELLLHVAGFGVLVLMYSVVTDRERLRKVLIILFIAATLTAAVGIAGYVTGMPMETGWVDTEAHPDLETRAYAPFGNPNVLSQYLLFLWPLSLVLTWTAGHRAGTLAFGAGALLQLVCILLTFTRSAWVALVPLALVYALLVDRRLLWLGAAGVAAAVPLLPRVGTLITRAVSIFTLEDTSALYRLRVWEEVMLMVGEFPVTGVGLGHRAFRMLYPYFALERWRSPFHAHNGYLQMMAEIGIFGLLGFLAYLASVSRGLWRRWQRADDRFLQAVTGALLATVAAILAFSLFETVIYLPKIIILFWLLMGLAHAAAEMPPAEDRGGRGGEAGA